MNIVALCIVSASELWTVDNKYTEEYLDQNPEELQTILYSLGMNTGTSIEVQEVTHRNRFNNVVTCKRWVGNERLDKEWLNSGYASQEAKDKATGSKMLADLYRLRGAVE